MRGIPPAGTEVLQGRSFARVWYDYLLGLSMPSVTTLKSYTVFELPSNPPDAQMAFCSNEVGGAVPVFSFGGQWLRVTDRAVAS